MNRCWRLKSAVIKSILDANGSNDYELPHGYVEWKPTVQGVNDSSSDDDEPLARALTFEEAEGVSHDKKSSKVRARAFPSLSAILWHFTGMQNFVIHVMRRVTDPYVFQGLEDNTSDLEKNSKHR